MEKYAEVYKSIGFYSVTPSAEESKTQTHHAMNLGENKFELFSLIHEVNTAYSSGMQGLSQEIYEKVGTTV